MPHTPGPWHWNDRGFVYADVPDGITVPGASDPFYGGHLVGESICPSNGKLIASAPDLLAALKTAEELLVSAMTRGLDFKRAVQSEIIANHPDMKAIRAAIAKAEGR